MSDAIYTFGPKSRDEEVVFAVEALISEAQVAILMLMDEKGVTKTQLAKDMKVSQARISRILGDSAQNITLETLARVFHVLGEQPEIRCQKRDNEIKSSSNASDVWISARMLTIARRAANQNWPSCSEENDHFASKASAGNAAAFLAADQRRVAFA